MNLSIISVLFLASTISFAAPAISAVPAGQKTHKEIKSGVITTPATSVPVVTKPISKDTTKAKK